MFNRTPSDCPCKGCGDREVGCHGTCETYGEWPKKHRANMERIAKERQETFTMSKSALKRNWTEAKKNRAKCIGRG